MQKDLLDGGGNTPQKTFSISYMLNSRNQVFNPYLLISTMFNVKITLGDNLRATPAIFSREKILFSLQLLF